MVVKHASSHFFVKLYKNFSSGNKVVDELIKNPTYILPNDKCSREKNGRLKHYSWIPWEHLSNITEIGRGGFGIIYKANVIDGLINEDTIKHHGSMKYERLKRNEEGMEVAIKIIKNSEEVFKELNIQRVMFINNDETLDSVSSMYGITQNSETLEYGIVMEFAKHGDMRKYLSTNFHSISWFDKLFTARSIASGLSEIHSSRMVHRDLHSGNILQYEQGKHAKEKNIYGVIPYIPPEVLRGEKFTMAGDIYSYGMLLWELATGKPPFYDCTHDHILIMAILNGARPKITSPLIPPFIAELIVKCWDVNPKNRPTAWQVFLKLWELKNMYRKFKNKRFADEDTTSEEFKTEMPEMKQFLESDKYVKEMLKNDMTNNTSTTTNIHPGAVYTSRVLSLQMIEETKVYLPKGDS
ncbi:hypothetical protein G9A89_014722 [Geosiphon pyriformis]|nr:hypothetical protein G9A89_014722 [Geosiphon pyriformis]